PVVDRLAWGDGRVLVSGRFADDEDPPLSIGDPLEPALAAVGGDDPGLAPDVDSLWALIFTSGTSDAPKAVRCSQRRILVTGHRMGGIAVNRTDNPPPGALGVAGTSVKVVDDDGNERAPARFDGDGALLNAEECVGEIVNTAGAGPFEGYYNNDEANARSTRNGWYW